MVTPKVGLPRLRPSPAKRLALSVAFFLVLSGCGGASNPTDAELVSATLRIDIDGCRLGKVRATGVALDGGWIATVAHSFDGVESYSVVGRQAKLVYLDLERDLALLWGEPPDSSFSVTLGDNTEVANARVVSYPTPDDPPEVFDIEILRLANVTLDGEGRRKALEIVAEINPGDSGSPIVDDDGRLIGIVFATARGKDSGWAISVEEVISALDLADREPVTPPRCS